MKKEDLFNKNSSWSDKLTHPDQVISATIELLNFQIEKYVRKTGLPTVLIIKDSGGYTYHSCDGEELKGKTDKQVLNLIEP